MNWIAKLIIQAFAVFLTAYLLTGVHIEGFFTAIVVAFVLSILNFIFKPLLIILTIPATILSLGLFLFVINAIIIMLADDLVGGFRVDSFWWALLFSIILSVFNSLMTNDSKRNKNKNEL